jgi:putative addiction module component (TIGR02574 family)
MALWDSLTALPTQSVGRSSSWTAEQEAELDRRLEEHLANPGSAILWEEVRRKLASGA